MKKILIASEKFRIIICLLLMISCTKTKEDTPTPKPCNISGTSVNIGSTTGGTFTANVGTASCPLSSAFLLVYFDNRELNFYVGSFSSCRATSVVGILDAGVQKCLDFTYLGSPSAPKVSYMAGHGYVGQFNQGILSNLLPNHIRMA